MNKPLFLSASLCGLALLLAFPVATAMPIPIPTDCMSGQGLPCVFNSTISSHNKDKKEYVQEAIFDATGTHVNLTFYGKTGGSFSGNGSLSGTWDLPDGVLIDYLTVKAANEFAVYFVGGANSGTWSTIGLDETGNSGNKQQHGLSHLSFFYGSGISVPEPPVLLLMALSLVGLGFMLGRRRH